MTGLRGLRSRLQEVQAYLEAVVDGRLPVNHDIMRNLQDIFNLLPNLNVAELTKSFAVEANDMMMVVYVSSLVRSVVALHNLIDNKEVRAHSELEQVKKEKEKLEAEKDKGKAGKENASKEKEGDKGTATKMDEDTK